MSFSFRDFLGALRGLLLTWAEWHMIVSGLGDGLALSKAEKIPTIQETEDKYKVTDFYAILAREAWYYKIGMGIGRLAWGGLVIAGFYITFGA